MTAYVRTTTDVSPETGNSVVFAQRYAADGAKIGNPVEVTSDQVGSFPISTLLLSNGGFVVSYETTDPNGATDPFGPATRFDTQEVSPDNRLIGTGVDVPDDFYTFPGTQAYYQSTALSGGAYAFILETTSFEQDVGSTVASFGYVDANGTSTLRQLYTNQTQFGPYPNPTGQNLTLQHGTDTFDVSYDIFNTQDPDYPGPPNQHFEDIYGDDGVLLRTVVVTDGGPTVFTLYDPAGQVTATLTRTPDGASDFETLDPATGRELSEYVRNADRSRTVTNLAVSGQPYTSQEASYDASGKLTKLERGYANGMAQLVEFAKPDGSSTVDIYDTQNRIITYIATAADGSRAVTVRTFAGTSTTPVTSELVHYDKNNQLVANNVTNANGTHERIAYVSGITLVSTGNVTDRFVSAPAGGDTFVFHPAFGQDLITGFHAGNGANHDLITFDKRAVPDYAHLQGEISSSGGNTLIKVDATDTILLKGVAASSLTANDFVFEAYRPTAPAPIHPFPFPPVPIIPSPIIPAPTRPGGGAGEPHEPVSRGPIGQHFIA